MPRSHWSLVTNPPFSLAYETLLESLITSDRWLIAGYSFRDECVNDLLAEAWDARSDVPEVMIVTHGEELTEKTVTDALAWNWATDPLPDTFLHFCRHGIQAAPTHKAWIKWNAPFDIKKSA